MSSCSVSRGRANAYWQRQMASKSAFFTHLQNLTTISVSLEEVLNEVCQRRLPCAKVVITHVCNEWGGERRKSTCWYQLRCARFPALLAIYRRTRFRPEDGQYSRMKFSYLSRLRRASNPTVSLLLLGASAVSLPWNVKFTYAHMVPRKGRNVVWQPYKF